MRPLEYWVLYVRMRTRRNMGNGAPARWDTLTWRGRGAHRAQIKSLTVIGAGEAAYSASFRSILLLSSLRLCFFVWLFPYKVNPWTASGPWHSSILRSPLRQNLKLGPSKSIPVNANWGAKWNTMHSLLIPLLQILGVISIVDIIATVDWWGKG